MKRDKSQAADRDMLPEYDFKRGVRGKYYGRIAKPPRVFLVPDTPNVVSSSPATCPHLARQPRKG